MELGRKRYVHVHRGCCNTLHVNVMYKVYMCGVCCVSIQAEVGLGALRDGNWRSPTTPDDDPAPGWSNQRQPPPSPGVCIL